MQLRRQEVRFGAKKVTRLQMRGRNEHILIPNIEDNK